MAAEWSDRRATAWAAGAPDLRRAAETGRLVPSTARSVEQFERVRLPGPPPPYAVCGAGARLLVDGVPDLAWTARTTRVLADAAPPAVLRGVVADAIAGCSLGSRLRDAEGVYWYVVAGDAALADGTWPAGWTLHDALAGALEDHGWRCSLAGRRLHCLPRGLDKAAAVLEAVDRLGGGALLAAGDSDLDAGMLAAADRGLALRDGPLHQSGEVPATVELTERPGPVGGAEVAAAVADWVSGATAGFRRHDPR